mmetsp:Transcript_116757/g.363585  ORF Transcript_116757/g.363585 Transcript_116757/m.363585 type:complete len:213 (-) Transcript_116757:219-857(-)
MDNVAIVPLVAGTVSAFPRVLGQLCCLSPWHSDVLRAHFIAALGARARHRHGPIALRAFSALERLAESGVGALGHEAAACLDAMIADRPYMLRAVRLDERVVRHLPSDREMVVAALGKSAGALRYASPEFQADRDIVLAALRKDADALRHAAPELQADPEIVLEALRRDASVLAHAAPALRFNVAFSSNAHRLQREQLPFRCGYEGMATGMG